MALLAGIGMVSVNRDGENGSPNKVSFSPSCLRVHSFAFPALPGPFEKRLEGSEFIFVPNCSKLKIPWEVLEIILLC